MAPAVVWRVVAVNVGFSDGLVCECETVFSCQVGVRPPAVVGRPWFVEVLPIDYNPGRAQQSGYRVSFQWHVVLVAEVRGALPRHDGVGLKSEVR